MSALDHRYKPAVNSKPAPGGSWRLSLCWQDGLCACPQCVGAVPEPPLQALSQYLHRLALTLFDKFSGIDDFSPRSGWIPGHCQNGRNVIRDFGRLIKIEQLVTRTNVPSHETFAGLLGEPSDDRRDTIANRHDR